MPCAFYAPMVMTIHTDLAGRHIQRLAASSSYEDMNDKETKNLAVDPYILAGDWNFKPGDSSYRLMTTGMMDRGAPEWPTPKYTKYGVVEWKPSLKPMRSAYAVASSDGKTEPDFTNFARVQEDEPFIDTLDYIFISDEWNVQEVKPLPNRRDSDGPYPNLDRNEPSDHIMIGACLILP